MSQIEQWKPAVGYDGLYEVSNLGRVRTHYTSGRILEPSTDGYYFILHLSGPRKGTRRVHILVLEAFIGPRPKGKVSRHLDGNPYNNAADNLAWGTQKENMDDRRKHGTHLEGSGCGQAKLNEEDVVKMRAMRNQGMTMAAIAKHFPISSAHVCNVLSGKTWKHVPPCP